MRALNRAYGAHSRRLGTAHPYTLTLREALTKGGAFAVAPTVRGGVHHPENVFFK